MKELVAECEDEVNYIFFEKYYVNVSCVKKLEVRVLPPCLNVLH